MVEWKEWTPEGKSYMYALYRALDQFFRPLKILNLTIGRGYTLQFYPYNCDVTGVDLAPNIEFDSVVKEKNLKLELVKSDYFEFLSNCDLSRFNHVEIDTFSTKDSQKLLLGYLKDREIDTGYHTTFYDTPIKRNFTIDTSVYGGEEREKLPKEIIPSLPFLFVHQAEKLGWKHKLFLYTGFRSTHFVGGILSKKEGSRVSLNLNEWFSRDRNE